MPVRTAEAEWKGNLHEGQGRMKLGTGAYEGPFSFQSRMENGPGTNPEELIGAAHAGCFSMAFSAQLSNAENAIEKHPACAAPINSSGFVPGPFSMRDWNEKGPS